MRTGHRIFSHPEASENFPENTGNFLPEHQDIQPRMSQRFRQRIICF